MCTVKKELLIDFRDLRCIDIECAECGMHTTIDVADRRTKIPPKCPGCQAIFESVGLQGALLKYMEIYRMLVDLKQKITIRIPMEEEKP
jgi:hypothetical protein